VNVMNLSNDIQGGEVGLLVSRLVGVKGFSP
jgi:hypothetical protein